MKNFVIITDKCLLGHAAAFYCLVPPLPSVILISPKYKNDGPLFEHERQHFEQYKKAPFTYAYKMLTDDKYRYKMEVECYAKQLDSLPAGVTSGNQIRKMSKYAEFITTRYRLDVPMMQAFNALSKRLSLPFTPASKARYWAKQILAAVVLALPLVAVL